MVRTVEIENSWELLRTTTRIPFQLSDWHLEERRNHQNTLATIYQHPEHLSNHLVNIQNMISITRQHQDHLTNHLSNNQDALETTKQHPEHLSNHLAILDLSNHNNNTQPQPQTLATTYSTHPEHLSNHRATSRTQWGAAQLYSSSPQTPSLMCPPQRCRRHTRTLKRRKQGTRGGKWREIHLF